MKNENRDVNGPSLTKLCSDAWKTMDDKAKEPYKRMAEEEMERYRRDYAEETR